MESVPEAEKGDKGGEYGGPKCGESGDDGKASDIHVHLTVNGMV